MLRRPVNPMSCTTVTATLFGLVLAAGLYAPCSWAEDEWSVTWKNGFRVESEDQQFKLKFGGRMQADWSFPSADSEVEAAFEEIKEAGQPIT